MIHSFSVSNYCSIREEAVLDMRIPGTAPALPHFRQSEARPDVRLPSVVVLMGPNGSGKTTLLRALMTAARIVSTPLKADDERRLNLVVPFYSKTAMRQPTTFRVDFEADLLAQGEPSELFRYEISVEHDEHLHKASTIRYEALFHFPKGRARRLFERKRSDEPIYVSSEFGIKSNGLRKVVRPDASVISTMALLNVPLANLIIVQMNAFLLASNIMYFAKWVIPTQAVIDMFEKTPQIRERIKREIQRSDLAIRDVSIRDNGAGARHVFFKHHGLDREIPLFFESSGTKCLFHLLPQIDVALDGGLPAVLDEIDGDLHVGIVSEILHRFRSQETNPHNAQLIVTSHNVGLIDDLEKEELFIVEKSENGATRVHGAQDVRELRRDTRLYPKYRAGVLGGIPKIG